MKLKTTSFTKTNRQALKSLSRSTPAMSPSASPRHSDTEGHPRLSKGTKKFLRHFTEAPPNEWVLNYFSCALVSDILLQGTLYITPNFFGFYSKIFGHVSRLLIPVTQVASLQKERTAKIIPNAVRLQMLDQKSYVFGSLLSRDSTYKLMQHILKKVQRMTDSDSEIPTAVQVAVEEDAEDSVSGSGESLTEDQTDGFLVSDIPPSAPRVDSPWLPDEAALTAVTDNCTATLPPIANNAIAVVEETKTSSINAPNEGSKPVAAILDKPRDATGKSERENYSLLQWIAEGSLTKTCFRVGSLSVRIVVLGLREVWTLPSYSLLLLLSTLLLLLLFASAAFMLHRVDILSQQLGLDSYEEYDTMYEEVLQMQQRLHAASSTEIEKTLSIQLKHIATVRESLEALMLLFNKDQPSLGSPHSHIKDKT